MRNFYLDEHDLLKHVRRRLSQDTPPRTAEPQHAAEENSPHKPKQRSLWQLVTSLGARRARRKPGIYPGAMPICVCALVKEGATRPLDSKHAAPGNAA